MKAGSLSAGSFLYLQCLEWPWQRAGLHNRPLCLPCLHLMTNCVLAPCVFKQEALFHNCDPLHHSRGSRKLCWRQANGADLDLRVPSQPSAVSAMDLPHSSCVNSASNLSTLFITRDSIEHPPCARDQRGQSGLAWLALLFPRQLTTKQVNFVLMIKHPFSAHPPVKWTTP